MKNLIIKTLSILLLILMVFSIISFALVNNVLSLAIGSVSLTDGINPGKTTKINIEIKNDASEDIEDISIVLDLNELPFAPYNSASEYNIEKIREDNTKFAEFEIIALNNAKSVIYKIPVTITYKQNESVNKKNFLISLIVDSKPNIDVSLEKSILLKGKNNEFFIKITNKGLSDTKFVELEINKGKYNLLSEKKYYIGDIDSNDFESIKIETFFEKDSPNNINLPVSIIYKDELNKEYQDSFDLNLRVYSESEAIKLGLLENSNTVLYVFGILLTGVIYFIYRRLKKKVKIIKN